MSLHESKICPRCKREFECKSGNIIQCQCHGMKLSEEVLHELACYYDDCLCRTCLGEILAMNISAGLADIRGAV
jgi:hypothetical protein